MVAAIFLVLLTRDVYPRTLKVKTGLQTLTISQDEEFGDVLVKTSAGKSALQVPAGILVMRPPKVQRIGQKQPQEFLTFYTASVNQSFLQVVLVRDHHLTSFGYYPAGILHPNGTLEAETRAKWYEGELPESVGMDAIIRTMYKLDPVKHKFVQIKRVISNHRPR